MILQFLLAFLKLNFNLVLNTASIDIGRCGMSANETTLNPNNNL